MPVTHSSLRPADQGEATTYEVLDANGDVGTGAGQVAIGDHNHDAAYSAIAHNHDADYADIAHTHALDDATDVDLTTTAPVTDDVLSFDGTNWVPAAVAAGGGGGGSATSGAWDFVKTVSLNQGTSSVDLDITLAANEVVMLAGVRIVKAAGGANSFIAMNMNSNAATTDYEWQRIKSQSTSASVTVENSTTSGNIRVCDIHGNGDSGSSFRAVISNNSPSWTTVDCTSTVGQATTDACLGYNGHGTYKSTADITQVTLVCEDATNIAGTVHVYKMVTTAATGGGAAASFQANDAASVTHNSPPAWNTLADATVVTAQTITLPTLTSAQLAVIHANVPIDFKSVATAMAVYVQLKQDVGGANEKVLAREYVHNNGRAMDQVNFGLTAYTTLSGGDVSVVISNVDNGANQSIDWGVGAMSYQVVELAGGGGGATSYSTEADTTTLTGNSKTMADTSSAVVGYTLPAGVEGEFVTVVDKARNAATNNITLTPASGESMLGVVDDTFVIDVDGGSVELVYSGTSWEVADTKSVNGTGITTGTFTPAFATTSIQPDSITYDTSATGGYWQRIGDVVTCFGRIQTDAITLGSANGGVLITGLPFAASSNSLYGVGSAILPYADNWGGSTPDHGNVKVGLTELLLRTHDVVGGPSVSIDAADFGTGAGANTTIFTLIYKTDD